MRYPKVAFKEDFERILKFIRADKYHRPGEGASVIWWSYMEESNNIHCMCRYFERWLFLYHQAPA
jgi:hypothetical protein